MGHPYKCYCCFVSNQQDLLLPMLGVLVYEVVSTFQGLYNFHLILDIITSTHYSIFIRFSIWWFSVWSRPPRVTPISLAFPRLVCRASRNALWHGDLVVVGSAVMKNSNSDLQYHRITGILPTTAMFFLLRGMAWACGACVFLSQLSWNRRSEWQSAQLSHPWQWW